MDTSASVLAEVQGALDLEREHVASLENDNQMLRELHQQGSFGLPFSFNADTLLQSLQMRSSKVLILARQPARNTPYRWPETVREKSSTRPGIAIDSLSFANAMLL